MILTGVNLNFQSSKFKEEREGRFFTANEREWTLMKKVVVISFLTTIEAKRRWPECIIRINPANDGVNADEDGDVFVIISSSFASIRG
jgi:hypothetical protein